MSTPQERARKRRQEGQRRAKLRAENHAAQIRLAEYGAERKGRDAGITIGARLCSGLILEAAGKLYKDGRDSEASAVREAYRGLPESYKSGDAVTNTEEKK